MDENLVYMYTETKNRVRDILRNKVNGIVRTEYNIPARILVIDICYKDFNFRKIITDFDKFVFGEMDTDEIISIVIGTYKNELMRTFFREGGYHNYGRY